MSTPISQFDYDLPPDMIAQEPISPRDHSKMLVLDKETGAIAHRQFFNIIDFLQAGDVLVFNNTKVFKARLQGRVVGARHALPLQIEVFLLRSNGTVWGAMIRPGKKVQVGDRIELVGASGDTPVLCARVLSKAPNGIVELDFGVEPAAVLEYCDKFGSVPTPPYVEQGTDLDTYQTVYAEKTGSVAAPTAGFHFTDELLEAIRDKGVQIEFVTLHVGIGTFQPVKTETLEEHEMHAEFVDIDQATAERINQAKQEGCRIIAVGTTTTRALEGVAAISGRRGKACLASTGYVGDVNLFIMPGFEFRVIDALITNFHLPKSTLISLVSALIGRANVLNAYEEAKKNGYRFYSFGDAMFI